VTSGHGRAPPERTPHPAQFPLDLVNRIVLGFSQPGDLVLDPFLGSGTVAVSCLEQGRNVLGIEIASSYCELAARRIQRVQSDKKSRLFS
jgi:adenine-specific DNA-methyltransferase